MTLESTLRRWWWVSALLVMVVEGEVQVESLTDTGKEAVRLVREEFHKTKKVKNAFQVSSILSTVYQDYSDGTYVEVELTMKKTNCKRHKWMNQNCTPKKKAKGTFHCVGCFTFGHGGDLLQTGYKKCLLQKRAKGKKVKKERREACADLKDELHMETVGAYSFQRSI